MRIAPSTKQRYETMLKSMREFWLKQHRCELTVPVERSTILSFFGYVIDIKHKDARRPRPAVV
jgi:hypothetical protein